MSWKQTTSTHLLAAQLRALQEGTLPAAHFSEVEAHLESCIACCDALAALPEDTFLLRLRRACDSAPMASEPPRTSTLLLPDSATLPNAAPAPILGKPLSLPGYEDIREMGRGGMGMVYAARHSVMGRRVAVKVVHPEFSCNAAVLERFRREVRAAARLAHPNIVTAHDAGEDQGWPFLVMEYVEGESLGDRLERLGPLPVAEASAAVRQAALGVQHAHDNGLIHRDLKPPNLLRTADGTVKVCDFGLAALTDDPRPVSSGTAPNAVMGTPDYMAPEQAENASTADGRADVYALGCTLYHLLTGQVPFPEESILLKLVAHRTRPRPSARCIRPEVPAALDDVLRRAMARRPQDRFQTAGELADALQPFRDPGRSVPERSRRWRTRLAFALLLVLGAAAIAGMIRLSAGKNQELPQPIRLQDSQAGSAGQKVWLKGYDHPVWSVAFSPDGRFALTSGGRDYLHECSTQSLVRRPGSGLWVAAFSPDGKYTLTSNAIMSSVLLSRTESGEEIRRIGNAPGGVRDAVFSPDGKWIAMSEWDSVHVYQAATGQSVTSVPAQRHYRPAFTFTSDSRRLLVIHSDNRSIRSYEPASGKEVDPEFVSPAPIRTLAVSPDGKTVLATRWEPNTDDVFVWDWSSGKLVRRLIAGQKLPDFNHRQVAFLPDSRRALVSNFEGTLILWDVASGRQLQRWDDSNRIVSLAVSADGRRALCGTYGKRAFLLRLPDASAEP